MRPSAAGAGEISLITEGTRIIGDIETAAGVRVAGTVAGQVRARRLEVTETGKIEGSVSTPDDATGGEIFVIAGRVDGPVKAYQVEVRRTGVVRGGITAEQAIVHGRVEKGIVARARLALEQSAVVEGTVRTKRLSLEEGGRVNGKIEMGEASSAKGKKKEDASATRAGAGAGAGKPNGKAASTVDEVAGQTKVKTEVGPDPKVAKKGVEPGPRKGSGPKPGGVSAA